FLSRPGLALTQAEENKLKEYPNLASFSWKGRVLTRIGAGLRGISSLQREHAAGLDALLKSPINVIETSQDETNGQDELMLGDALNALLDKGAADPEGLFFIVKSGLIREMNGRLADEMEKRKTPFPEVVRLSSNDRFCLHPDFLEDQLNRSLHRLGVGAVDLFLMRIPPSLPELIGREECCRIIRQASLCLQNECDRGRLRGFGLSAQGLAHSPASSQYLSLAEIVSQNRDLEGFQAVEFKANFIENMAFQPGESGINLVEQAKSLGLLTIVGGPLRAEFEGRELLLADYPELSSGDVSGNSILEEAAETGARIHDARLADGRTLKEILQDANIASPFDLWNLTAPFLQSKPVGADQSFQLEEKFKNSMSLARTLGGQLVQAGLLTSSHFREIIAACETVIEKTRRCHKIQRRSNFGREVLKLREKYFPGQRAELSLQFLGMKWLLDQGVDIVLNNMKHPSYVEEALKILDRFSESGKATAP
ncbi:MAG: hypothetical protein ACE5GQ_07060, partial [Nitrospinales bacterium]